MEHFKVLLESKLVVPENAVHCIDTGDLPRMGWVLSDTREWIPKIGWKSPSPVEASDSSSQPPSTQTIIDELRSLRLFTAERFDHVDRDIATVGSRVSAVERELAYLHATVHLPPYDPFSTPSANIRVTVHLPPYDPFSTPRVDDADDDEDNF